MSPQNSVTGEHLWTGGGNDESQGAALVIGTGGTITPGPNYTVRVAPAAAVTGVILAKGLWPAQECIIINESVAANSITPAVAGTSNIADGVSGVIAGLTAKAYVWDSIQQLWFREN